MLRDRFFYHVDKLLPRRLAAFPYHMALNDLKSVFLNTAEVWHRNSFYHGNYVFGLSDLDITLWLEKVDLSRLAHIRQKLLDQKGLYIFLGETNLYFRPVVESFVGSINYYERLRDPVLSLRLPEIAQDHSIDRIVFLLRMMYSDRKKLLKSPHLRQKKWKFHLQQLNVGTTELVNFDFLLAKILELTKSPELEKEVTAAVESLRLDFNEENIFRQDFPDSWKYLFPHKYLWFNEEGMEPGRNIPLIFQKICLRQIDWEIWGLMSQMPFMDLTDPGFDRHMTRLIKLTEKLSGSEEVKDRAMKLMEYSVVYRNPR